MTDGPSPVGAGRGMAGELGLVRQPVFDADGTVVAYQLLARSERLLDAFAALDESTAASQLLSDVFLEVDVWRLTENLPIHLRVPGELVIRDGHGEGGVVAALPPERTVLELADEPVPAPALLDSCDRLRRAGYLLALGGLVGAPGPLFGRVDILKVDVGRVALPEQHQLVARARRAGIHVVAEHVDTRGQEATARLLGYDAYQGRFFQQPALVRTRRLAGSRLAYLQLLKAANSSQVDFGEIADIVRRDVSLAWRFLNYINAAFFGWRRRIDSIDQGLVLLGEAGVRRWVSLMVVGDLGDGGPRVVVSDAACRARLCERIAERTGDGRGALDAFLVGMFSLLDAMLDEPLADILAHVSLPDDVSEAILHREGRLGEILALVTAYESGAWETVHARAAALGLSTAEVTAMYLDALSWAGTSTGTADLATS